MQSQSQSQSQPTSAADDAFTLSFCHCRALCLMRFFIFISSGSGCGSGCGCGSVCVGIRFRYRKLKAYAPQHPNLKVRRQRLSFLSYSSQQAQQSVASGTKVCGKMPAKLCDALSFCCDVEVNGPTQQPQRTAAHFRNSIFHSRKQTKSS